MRVLKFSEALRMPRRCSSVLGFALAAFLAVVPAVTAAETLAIGGSSAGLGTMRLLAAAFAKVEPGVTVSLLPNLGSSGGLKALGAGAIDVAVISHALKAEDAAQGLVGVEYGRTPFGVVTAKAGDSAFTSLAQLAEVYAGQRPAWPDGTPIRLVMFPKSGSDSAQLEAFSPAMKQAVQTALSRPGILVRSSDEDAADTIESVTGALGTNTLALISSEKRKLHMLPVNGVVPSAKTIADGTYPYFKSMALVRKAGAKGIVNSFFAFVASPRGRQILVDSGHWVVPAN